MKQPKPKSALRGLLLCALVPAVLAAVISPFLGVSVFIAAFLLAGFVGYPLFLLARRYSWATLPIACLAGALIGSGIAALMFWPRENTDLKTTAWNIVGERRIYTMVDGIPTPAAWETLPLFCGLFGVAGALAGIAFWVYASNPTRQPSGETNDK